MKKIIAFLTILCLSSACDKYLTQEPQTSKVSSTFLKTEIEVEEYVNALYGSLQTNGLYGLYLLAIAEVPSDIAYEEVPANDGAIFSQLDDFSVISSNDLIATNWKASYVAIQRANVILNRIDGISYKLDSVKATRKGEAKFVRALMYFNLVRTYGDVPLVITETTDPNKSFGQARTPVAQVYTQMIQDLTEATGSLAVKASAQGRATKGAAKVLLAKVYLTQGNYTAAKTLLDDVYNNNLYSLLTNPSDVFTATNENSKEIIFSVQFASGVNGNTEGSTLYQQISPSSSGVSGSKGHILPTKQLYDAYKTGDKRKDVYVGLLTASGITFNKKYQKPSTVVTDGGSDFVVLRYADMLLMMAETENELGNTATAQTYLNKVRTRAGLSNTTATDQTGLRTAIDLERQLELVGEGHRWFDLLRTGQAVSVMNTWFTDNKKSTQIDSHNLLMPIPQNQVNTDNALKQNPGYN
jgi:starch-binding outer membrane protein, SusD/RagB family